MEIDEAVTAFTAIRDILYRIPLGPDEEDLCCSGKHILLKTQLDALGYTTRYRVCSFKWSELQLPAELVSIPHEDDSTHVYLEFEVGSEWRIVDATWDPALSAVLPVNEWDGISDTPVAVPIHEVFSIERSEEIMIPDIAIMVDDLEKNGAFYEGFNRWLEHIRAS